MGLNSCKRVAVVAFVFWLLVMLYFLVSDAMKANALINDRGASNINEKHERHIVKKIPEDKAIAVCLSSDDDNVIGMVTTINSVWRNTKHPVIFYLLVTTQAEALLRPWLERSDLHVVDYVIRVFDIAPLEGKVKVHGGRKELAKPMNYARYFYTEIFPELHGKVIHLDTDVIVQGDIIDLYHTPLDDGQIIAVAEDCNAVSKRFSHVQNTYNSYVNFDHAAIQATKLKPLACSFNVGVYVFDADLWRAENITQKLMVWVDLNVRENIYGNAKGGGGSQPPMMIVLYKRYSNVDPMWHVQHLGLTTAKLYSAHFLSHAKLLHWNGHYKPWKGMTQYANLWDKYYVPDPLSKIKPIRRNIAVKREKITMK